MTLLEEVQMFYFLLFVDQTVISQLLHSHACLSIVIDTFESVCPK